MKNYEFNRNEFEWAEDFYKVIKKKMNLPDYFGENPPALWDMLTGYIETPCKITFIGFKKNENEYNDYCINLILQCFKDVQKEYSDQLYIEFI